MSTPVVPPYTPTELAERIANGSLDLARLASTLATTADTVAAMQQTVAALANWVNEQIRPTPATTATGAGADAAAKGKKH